MSIDDTRQKINGIRGLKKEEKKAFNMVMDEIGEVKQTLSVLNDDMGEVKEDVSELKQFAVNQAKSTVEILELVNEMHKTITANTEDAAQMRGLKAIWHHKHFGYVVFAIFISIVSIGVSVAYFIEHSHQVSEISQSVK